MYYIYKNLEWDIISVKFLIRPFKIYVCLIFINIWNRVLFLRKLEHVCVMFIKIWNEILWL